MTHQQSNPDALVVSPKLFGKVFVIAVHYYSDVSGKPEEVVKVDPFLPNLIMYPSHPSTNTLKVFASTL